MLDMKTKVALFDTQTSNIKSVYYALLKVGFEVKIVKIPQISKIYMMVFFSWNR